MGQMKIGMIGLDTSHCTAFAELLHNEENQFHVPGGRIVKAFPGGSDAFSNSRNRVATITTDMHEKFGVEIVDSIENAVSEVDAVFLESVDGRQHLEQFEVIAPFGKPVFIDKPLATTAQEAQAILELSKKHGTPICSASSLRFATGIISLGEGKKVLGCEAFGPMAILDDFPGYFWYGIHSAEILFAKMGSGCKTVESHKTADSDVIVGVWNDGRIGTVRGFRYKGLNAFGASVFTDAGVEQGIAGHNPPFYAAMLPEILDFFKTGAAPVDPEESVEVIKFLEAANLSRENGQQIELA